MMEICYDPSCEYRTKLAERDFSKQRTSAPKVQAALSDTDLAVGNPKSGFEGLWHYVWAYCSGKFSDLSSGWDVIRRESWHVREFGCRTSVGTALRNRIYCHIEVDTQSPKYTKSSFGQCYFDRSSE